MKNKMLSHSGDSTRSTNTMLKIQLQKNLPTGKKLTLTNVKSKLMNNPMEVLLRKISMSPQQEKTATKAMITTSRNSPRKGMFILFNTQRSHKFVGYNNSTDHGKAVFNNKEYGYHLLAQPDRMNVRTTNLSDPKE